MMIAVLALGLVLVVEGLVLALMPQRMDDVMAMLARLGQHHRRAIGIAALAIGVGLVWLAQPICVGC